jgi:tetratricopeptide (TPR) repeat protein
MRSLLIGLYAGLVLSVLRAPLGLELLQVPATAAGGAMAYRAAALLVVAVGLILGLRSGTASFSPTTALVGAALGFQLHWQVMDTPSPVLVQGVFSVLLVALLVAGHRGGPDLRPNKTRIVFLAIAALGGWYLLDLGFPAGHAQAVSAACVGLGALAIVGRCTEAAPQPAVARDGPRENEHPPLGGLTAVAISGAGLTLLCEGVARHLRLFGGGLPVDDSVFGSVFLGLAALGALSFARLLQSKSALLLGRAAVTALSGLAAWGSFRVLENLADPRGLDLFLRKLTHLSQEELGLGFSLDLSMHGMAAYDLAIAGPVLVLPAFFCGTALGLFRRPTELAAALVGSAAGLVLSPGLLAFEWGARAQGAAPELLSSSHSASMALFGGMLAAGGALLACLTSADLGRRQRLVGCVLAFAGFALCRFPARDAIEILSPWEKREAQPFFLLDAPCGLVTVERDAAGLPVVTLDRRLVSPATADARADRERLALAWKLLGERPEGAQTDVLLIGQLTPDRALALADLGATVIDRTASWSSAMAPVERLLFEGAPNWVPGDVLSLAEARGRLGAGEYELVIVTPIAGPVPTTRNFASPESTTVVVWLDGASGVETQHLGRAVLATAPGLRELLVAVAHGPELAGLSLTGQRGAPGFLETGEPLDALPALEILNTRSAMRARLHRARLARRLADAERSPGLATALALHFEAQEPSSPFETPEEGVELTPQASQLVSAAAAGPAPDSLASEAIEALADIFRAQRRVEEIEQFLSGPAERHRPWPALEVALGQAALELLEPEKALEHLQRAHAAFAGSPTSLALWAEAQQQCGDDRGAARSLELAAALAPSSGEIGRRLAIAWRRVGDPRGREALAKALEEHPDDRELLSHQGGGPYPPPPPGYHVLVAREH